MTKSVFPTWQPRYADHGIPTFPVTAEKKPATTGYLSTGLSGSAKLARKFTDAEAFGFALGRRSNITLVDIDSKDERVLAEVLSTHGETPVISRTASGGYHAWYRHDGERRQIRPFEDKPIDVLGGGYAIAPPSRVAKGSYQFIEGRLDDLDRLPIMRAPVLMPALGRPEGLGSAAGTVPHGMRNRALYDHCMRAAHHCDDFDNLLDVARTFASMKCEVSISDPMTDAEVFKTAKWVWQKTEAGENWFGRGGRVVFHHDDIDGLMAEHPDAFLLEAMLRRHHWNRDFVIANAMAESMPSGGWDRKRFANARRVLTQRGRIEVVRYPRQQSPGIYRWPKLRKIQGGEK
jgi:Bifunctional DNA primase/polymerase, N-terminal